MGEIDINYIKFKEIFHNNFIRNLIYSFLHTPNGKKYYEITSAHFITTNKLFELLKYKLKRDEKLNHWSSESVVDICRDGDLELVKLVDNLPGMYFTSECMDSAAFNGKLDIIKWLHENRIEGCTNLAMDLAAARGHLETVKWLHYNRTEGCTNLAIDQACKKGHLEIVKFLFENRKEGATFLALDKAVLSKNMELIRYIVEVIKPGCSLRINDFFGESNNVEAFNYIYEEKKLFKYVQIGLLVRACKVNSAEIVERVLSIQVLRDQIEEQLKKKPIFKRILGASAGSHGSIKVLDILHKYNLLDQKVNYIDCVTMHGTLESVKWFWENGYKNLTDRALNSTKGKLDMIKYLNEVCKAPCTKTCADINHSYPEIIKYLLENRKEGCSKQCFMMACENGVIETVKLLASKYPTSITNHGFYSSAFGNHLEIFKYVETIVPEKNLFPLDLLMGILEILCKKGHTELLEYFYKKYSKHPSMIKLFTTNPSLLYRLGQFSLHHKFPETYEFVRNEMNLKSLSNIHVFEIVHAIITQNVEQVRKLCEKNHSMKKIDQSILFLQAVIVDNLEIIKILLKTYNFFAISWLDQEEASPINKAIESGYFDMVKLFINKSNVDHEVVQEAIYCAAEYSDIGILDYIIKLKPKYLTQPGFKNTLVSICSESITCLEYLQKHIFNLGTLGVEIDNISQSNAFTLFKHLFKTQAQLKTPSTSVSIEILIEDARKTVLQYIQSFDIELPIIEGSMVYANLKESDFIGTDEYYEMQENDLAQFLETNIYNLDPYFTKKSDLDAHDSNTFTDNSVLPDDSEYTASDSSSFDDDDDEHVNDYFGEDYLSSDEYIDEHIDEYFPPKTQNPFGFNFNANHLQNNPKTTLSNPADAPPTIPPSLFQQKPLAGVSKPTASPFSLSNKFKFATNRLDSDSGSEDEDEEEYTDEEDDFDYF